MTRRESATAAIALAAAVAWQLYAVALAFRHARVLGQLLEGLGGPLPWATRSLLASYRFWIAVPLAFAALSLHLLRRRTSGLATYATLLVAALAAALLLHAWVQEAFLAPLLAALRAIG